MSKSAPRAIRWRDKILNDPRMKHRAKVAAMALVNHADVNGDRCWVGAERCADEMGVSVPTIKRGWSDLKAAGYLIMEPRHSKRGRRDATKVMLFPSLTPQGSAAQGSVPRDQFDPLYRRETKTQELVQEDQVRTEEASSLSELEHRGLSACGEDQERHPKLDETLRLMRELHPDD